MTALMLVVLCVVIMVFARDCKLGGGLPCFFCGSRDKHSPNCPARGMQ